MVLKIILIFINNFIYSNEIKKISFSLLALIIFAIVEIN
jgi:hypothetical protein